MHIVRSGAADKFDSLVSELGQNPVEIMAAVGLSAAQFRDPDTYLAYPRLAELLEEAAARCQQPLFGALSPSAKTCKVWAICRCWFLAQKRSVMPWRG